MPLGSNIFVFAHSSLPKLLSLMITHMSIQMQYNCVDFNDAHLAVHWTLLSLLRELAKYAESNFGEG